MKYERSRLPAVVRAARWLFSRGLACFILFLAGSFVYVCTCGFPSWLVERCARAWSEGPLVVQVRSIRLDPFAGFVVGGVRVFRKGVPGPAGLDAETIWVRPETRPLFSGRVVPRRVRLRGAVLRPTLILGPERRPAEKVEPAPDEDLPIEIVGGEIHGIAVERMRFRYRTRGPITTLEDIEADVRRAEKRGTVRGDVRLDGVQRTVEGRFTARVDPGVFQPAFLEWQMPGMARFFDRFEFRETAPPNFALDVRVRSGSGGSVLLNGTFDMEDASFRNVRVRRSDGRFCLDLGPTNSTLTIQPLYVFRDEGSARCGMVVDFVRDTVRFEGNSTLQPKELLRLAWLEPEELLPGIRILGPCKIAAEGSVAYGETGTTRILAAVEGGPWEVGKVRMDECAFRLRVAGPTNVLSDVRGRAYGGTWGGEIEVVQPFGSATQTAYRAQVDVRDSDLSRLIAGFAKAADYPYKGKVSGTVRVEGVAGRRNLRAAKGEGSISVREGKIFTMPLFGGLTDVLASVIPGLNFVVCQTDASADFAIRDGKIHSDKVLIEGDVFSLKGRGDYGLDGSLDFLVQVKLLKERTLVGKAVQSILGPLSWLLEFHLTGTVDKPDWYASNFSRDIFRKLGLSKSEGEGN